MNSQYVRHFNRAMIAVALAMLSILILGQPVSHADTQDTPVIFVNDRVGSMTLHGTNLFWKTNCGDEFAAERSRLRRTDSRGSGGTQQTLYFPSGCPTNRIASANVAVDNDSTYWLTGDGKLVSLPRAATNDTPTLIVQTGMTSIIGEPSCCWIAVDNDYIYWNENRRIMRRAKSGGPTRRMLTAAGEVRDLRARGDGALFYRDGHQLKLVFPVGTGFGNALVSGGVTDYALNDDRVFWLSNTASGYFIQSKTRAALDDLRVDYTSASVTGLRANSIAADNAKVYWHEMADASGGEMFALTLGELTPIALTSNVLIESQIISDGAYLFWTDFNQRIYRVPVTPTAPVTGDIFITGVEVTQGIQVFPPVEPQNHEIPLVGDKLTIVRVYAKSIEDSSGQWNNIRARLNVPGIGTVYPRNNNFINPFITLSENGSNRRNFSDSFLFILPPNATAPGARELEIEIYDTLGRPEVNLENNRLTHPVVFGPARTLELYGMTYANTNNGACGPNAAPNGVRPSFRAFEPHRQFTENVFPVSTVIIRPMPGNPQQSFENSDCGGYLTAHNWMRDYLESTGLRGQRGYLLTPDDVYGGWCCNGSNANLIARGANTLSLPGEVMAHEIGHMFLPGGCHTFEPCFGYPHADESIGNQMGVKIRPALEIRPGRNPDDSRAFGDIMSYSPPTWVSPYTYCWLFAALSSNAIQCATDVSPAEPPSAPSAATVENQSAAADYLYVGGYIRSDNTVELVPFQIVNSNKNLTTPSTGNQYSIALQGESSVLAGYAFNKTGDVHPGESEPPTFFSAYLPWSDEAKSIQLYYGDNLLAERQVSAHAPKVRVLTTGGGTFKGKQLIEWKASDADGDTLWYSVQYSADNGATWMPLTVHLTQKKFTVNFGQVPGATQGRLRVVASDGVNTTIDEMNESFQVPFKKPVVSIIGPEHGSVIKATQAILLQATAYDWEDGGIAAHKQFVWTSDRDGELGVGSWLDPTLTPGEHTITVTVTDASGKKGKKNLKLTVAK